jgi:hypothetical protein
VIFHRKTRLRGPVLTCVVIDYIFAPVFDGYGTAVRDFTTDQSCMALNTVTVRKQGDLQAIIDACLRHKIPAIVPWREQVAELGLRAASRAIERAGLVCRGIAAPA